jgi:hypothetical protein
MLRRERSDVTDTIQPMAHLRCDFFSETLALSTSMTVILPQATSTQIGMTGQAGTEPPGPVPAARSETPGTSRSRAVTSRTHRRLDAAADRRRRRGGSPPVRWRRPRIVELTAMPSRRRR